MSPGQVDVAVPFDFLNCYLLLTYLLTYLKVINPHISGAAAAIVTKLRGLNASPLGGKTAQFGRYRKISNTTSGPVGQRSTQKRETFVWKTVEDKFAHIARQGVPHGARCNRLGGMFKLFFLIYLFNFLWKAISACCEVCMRLAESGLRFPEIRPRELKKVGAGRHCRKHTWFSANFSKI